MRLEDAKSPEPDSRAQGVTVSEKSDYVAGKVTAPTKELEEQRKVSDGAVDIRGNPCVKSQSGNWKACCLIFGCEVCERVAFYAISSNLVIYLTTVLHEDVSTSAKNVNNWGGTTFMTPLLGAFVADAFLGRYWTITGFSCCYFLVRDWCPNPKPNPPNCCNWGVRLLAFGEKDRGINHEGLNIVLGHTYSCLGFMEDFEFEMGNNPIAC